MEQLVKSTKEYADWWESLDRRSRNSPLAEGNGRRTVGQLPVYSEDYPRTYKFIEDQPLFLQNQISAIRKIVTQEYDAFMARFEGVDKTAKKAMKTMRSLNKAFQEEWSIIPKAAAITIGGLAGFVLGMKRSTIRRVLYTGVGLLSMAAFCYPNETVAIVRTGVTHSRIYWQNFKDAPSPNRS